MISLVSGHVMPTEETRRLMTDRDKVSPLFLTCSGDAAGIRPFLSSLHGCKPSSHKHHVRIGTCEQKKITYRAAATACFKTVTLFLIRNNRLLPIGVRIDDAEHGFQ